MLSRLNVTKCGTCRYWMGARQAVYLGNAGVKMEIQAEAGICLNVHSPKFCGKLRNHRAKCRDYIAWRGQWHGEIP